MPQFADFATITVGNIKVSYLTDGGGIVIPGALYPASTEAGWAKYPNLLNDDGQYITTIGAFLIESGDQVVAVDTGIGPVTIDFPGFGPFSGGKYLDSLAQTGFGRDQVTDLIYTHLHIDHVGWTTVAQDDGSRTLTYPNARVLVTQDEWDFWNSQDNPAGPDKVAVRGPIEDRLQFVSGGDEIAPGVTVISTPGHTPGHISLLIDGGGDDRLFLLGDLLHGEMQLRELDWSAAFDIDAAAARKSRERMYSELVKPNTLSAANHFSDYVFGRISRDGEVYKWSPIKSGG